VYGFDRNGCTEWLGIRTISEYLSKSTRIKGTKTLRPSDLSQTKIIVGAVFPHEYAQWKIPLTLTIDSEGSGSHPAGLAMTDMRSRASLTMSNRFGAHRQGGLLYEARR
jgi:hypothetical protein